MARCTTCHQPRRYLVLRLCYDQGHQVDCIMVHTRSPCSYDPPCGRVDGRTALHMSMVTASLSASIHQLAQIPHHTKLPHCIITGGKYRLLGKAGSLYASHCTPFLRISSASAVTGEAEEVTRECDCIRQAQLSRTGSDSIKQLLSH